MNTINKNIKKDIKIWRVVCPERAYLTSLRSTGLGNRWST